MSENKLPRGVRVRGASLEINFTWEGKTRFVTVPGLPVSKLGITQAAAIREMIKMKIASDTFTWAEFFPNHKFARTELKATSRFSVAELLNEWLESQEGILAPKYYKNSKYKIESILIPAFGHLPVSILSPGHIREWAKKQDLARSTISNYLVPLRSAIREAIDDTKIDTDPLESLVLPKQKLEITQRIEERREEVNPYSLSEVERILSAARTEAERNVLQFAIWTGVRPGELIALEWRHIDLKKGTAYICQAISDGKMSDIKTKAKGRGEIMLLPMALQALKRQRAISSMLPHGRVFVNAQQSPYINYNQLYTAFDAVCRKAGVINRGVGQTRHTFASWMLMGGESITWVAKMLRHTTTEMVIRHYGKFISDDSPTGYTLKGDWGQGLAGTWQGGHKS